MHSYRWWNFRTTFSYHHFLVLVFAFVLVFNRAGVVLPAFQEGASQQLSELAVGGSLVVELQVVFPGVFPVVDAGYVQDFQRGLPGLLRLAVQG